MTATTIFGALLWLYSGVASMVFGAAIYETLVVHPAWSRNPPESFGEFMGAPANRLNIAAFWKRVAPLYALSAIAALAMALRSGVHDTPLIVSSVCAVAGVVWTLAYFRPTVERFLEAGGGNASADQLRAQARQWILRNWIRTALVAVAWWGVIAALAAHR